MARLLDILSFLLTSAVVVGVVFGILVLVRKCSAVIDSTKASLEKRGLTVSREGVAVQSTSKRGMDHERYLDATQRGIVKAVQASTFGGPAQASTWSGPAHLSVSSLLRLNDHHTAVGGGLGVAVAAEGESVAAVAGGSGGSDTGSEAGSEHSRRHLFRRYLN